jgi:FkbM family methyltransferase
MTELPDSVDAEPKHPDAVAARREFRLLVDHLHRLPPRLRARLQSLFTHKLIADPIQVDTPAGPISFVLLGTMSGSRAVTSVSKQPATIAWIDAFPAGSIFWDIGANVGVYTLYAALRKSRVVAFEPAAVNYFLLAANCEANRVDDRVDCLLVGVGAERRIARLDVSQFKGAGSFTFEPKPDDPHGGQQSAIILPIDELVGAYRLPCPNYIKIDAPGATEPIIAGASETLQRRELRELHIEMSAESKRGQRIVTMLEQAGFVATARHVHGAEDLTFTRTS